jgi:predicted dehydrogenase
LRTGGDEVAAQTVRWGLVGCGDIAKKRVAAALRDAEGSALVGVSRAQAHLAEAFARDHGARLWFADWRDLVRDAAVDAIYVATPVDVHADQAVAAAEAGKHVLCEKPMALSLADCDRMVAACRANDVRLGVAYRSSRLARSAGRSWPRPWPSSGTIRRRINRDTGDWT